ARCGRPTNPIAAALEGTPQGDPGRPYRPQPRASVRRYAAPARPARAPRAAKLRPRREGREPRVVSIDRIAFRPLPALAGLQDKSNWQWSVRRHLVAPRFSTALSPEVIVAPFKPPSSAARV